MVFVTKQRTQVARHSRLERPLPSIGTGGFSMKKVSKNIVRTGVFVSRRKSGGEKTNKTKTWPRLLSCVYTRRCRWHGDKKSKYFYEKINHTPLLCNMVTYVGHKCNTERVQRVCFCFVRETKSVYAAPEMHRARRVWTASAVVVFIPGQGTTTNKNWVHPIFRPIWIIFRRIAESLKARLFSSSATYNFTIKP